MAWICQIKEVNHTLNINLGLLNRYCFIFIFILSGLTVSAQLSKGGIPPSSRYGIQKEYRSIVHFGAPDLTLVSKEDSSIEQPYRYGIFLPVDFSPSTSGIWESLGDHGRIWRLTVHYDKALALSACFSRFYIPPGGELFLYDRDKTKIIGAFNEQNNSAAGIFSTELIPGDEITLEYFEPFDTRGEVQLLINEIQYAYRGVEFLQPGNSQVSGSCEVNVNCPEGEAWQYQKKGIVRISVKKGGSSFWCSGTVLNNVRKDHTPYVLTADHCGIAATPDQLLQWVFYFNYEALQCLGLLVPTEPKTLTGAIKVAESGSSAFHGSDFYMVVLTQPIPDSYDVFYNGWDVRNIPSQSGVGIHHPQGDVKKISTYTRTLETAYYGINPDPSFWRVYWAPTQSNYGVTEPGSSGSPLFDANGRVIGALTGGESACDTASRKLPDYYGKIFWSWDKNGSDSAMRLNYWLDPDSTGVKFIDGHYVGISEKKIFPDPVLFPNPFTDMVNIRLPQYINDQVIVRIYNPLGTRVFETRASCQGDRLLSIHCPGMVTGLYTLKIFTSDHVHSLKLIRK